MENRVAAISIIVSQGGDVENMNAFLSEHSDYIIGRMGIPYKQKGVNIISIVLDAPQDVIAALSGKIGSLTGISAKTAYAAKN